MGAPHEGDTKTPADDRHRHGAATGQAPRKDNGPQAVLNLVYQLGRGCRGTHTRKNINLSSLKRPRGYDTGAQS